MLIVERVFNFINHPSHLPKLNDCPICKSDVTFANDSISKNYFIVCPSCKLVFGLPLGYSSIKYLFNDWNHQDKTKEST